MQKVYGYVRVSAKDQNEDRQMIAMREANVPEKNIVVEEMSGADFERPKYMRLMRRLRRNDVLYVKSIDRLGRNYAEIQEQWRILTKEKGADIVVLDMPILDTRIGKDLIGTFVSDIVLQVLSFVAENKRTNIRQRQAEGIAAAKEKGVHCGHPFNALLDNFEEVCLLWKAGELTATAAAQKCGMSRSTFSRRADTNKVTVSVKGHNAEAESDNKTVTDVIVSAERFSFTLKKTDSVTGAILSGAVFGVYANDDKLLGKVTTGTDGTVTVETDPAAGFLLLRHRRKSA